MKMRRAVAFILSLLLTVLPVTPVLADTLSISAWSTGDSLSSNNLNSRMTSITTWSTKIANDNILSTAAIVGSKLDLTSGTARISHSTSVTSDAPVFTSGQTWNNVATVFSMWRGTVTNTNSASSSRLIDLRVGSTIIASVSRVGQLMLSPQDYASGPSTLMEGVWLNIASATYTDNMTAASGTAPRFMAYAFQRPALAAANSSVTTTHAATVFIASAPVAGDNMTLTNRYALWVDQGDVRLGGAVFASGAATIDGRLETRGALWAQGATALDGAVTLGNAAGDNITITGTVTSNLIFTDNSYDIGASGATRPRSGYFGTNLTAGGVLYINDTANANMTTGFTINQGAADNEISAWKSSDVLHGMTTLAETDTFLDILKGAAADGGAEFRAFTEATSALVLSGHGVTDDTTKTTAGIGYVHLRAYKKTGTTSGATGVDANLVVIQDTITTRFIFDTEGSGHADVAWTTFDTHDDIALLASLERQMMPPSQQRLMIRDISESLKYDGLDLEAAGIIGRGSQHEENGKPRAMINMTKLAMLQTGAIRQVYAEVKRLNHETQKALARIAYLESLLDSTNSRRELAAIQVLP